MSRTWFVWSTYFLGIAVGYLASTSQWLAVAVMGGVAGVAISFASRRA